MNQVLSFTFASVSGYPITFTCFPNSIPQIIFPRLLQELASPDWDQDLPRDVLGLVIVAGGGPNEMKSMKGVSKTWLEGFNNSIVKLRISSAGPLLPFEVTFSERFPCLTSLDLGESPMSQQEVQAQLKGLTKLQYLVLGGLFLCPDLCRMQCGQFFSCSNSGLGELFSLRHLSLRGSDNRQDDHLKGLRGLQLSSLDLSGCGSLVPENFGFQHLEGLPLMSLNLAKSTVNDLGGLEKLPLTSLNLSGCLFLESLEGLRGAQSLKVLYLGGCAQLGGADLEPLVGLPITDLDLSDWHRNSLMAQGLEYLREMPLLILNLNNSLNVGSGPPELLGLEFLQGLLLTELNICGSKRMGGLGLQNLRGVPLSSLNLAGCDWVKAADLTFLMELPITRLDLGGIRRLTDEDLVCLAGLRFRSVTLSRCPMLSDGCLGVLMSWSELEVLEMVRCCGVLAGVTAEMEGKGVRCVR